MASQKDRLRHLLEENQSGYSCEELAERLDTSVDGIRTLICNLRSDLKVEQKEIPSYWDDRVYRIVPMSESKIQELIDRRENCGIPIESQHGSDAKVSQYYDLIGRLREMKEVKRCATLPGISSNFAFEYMLLKNFETRVCCFEKEKKYAQILKEQTAHLDRLTMYDISLERFCHTNYAHGSFCLVWLDGYALNNPIDLVIDAVKIGGLFALTSYQGRGRSREEYFTPGSNLQQLAYHTYGSRSHMLFEVFRKIRAKP